MKVLVLISLACLPVIGRADIMPNTPVTDLYSRADTVFLGQVSGATRLPHHADSGGSDWRLELLPLRIYKGPLSPRRFDLDVLDFNPNWGAPGNAGETLLVFASRSPSHGLVLTERLSFMGFGLAPGVPEHASGLDQIESDAVAIALAGGDGARGALELLVRFPQIGSASADALSAHAPLTDGPSEDIRLELLARFDTHRYLSDLAVAVSYQDAAGIGGAPLMFHIISDLSGPNDTAALRSLANGSSKAVRLPALLALRRLRDQNSIEFLVVKLRVSDSEEAYEALMGLAETTGRNDLATDLGTFEKNPTPHILAWENWWNAGGQKAQPNR